MSELVVNRVTMRPSWLIYWLLLRPLYKIQQLLLPLPHQFTESQVMTLTIDSDHGRTSVTLIHLQATAVFSLSAPPETQIVR